MNGKGGTPKIQDLNVTGDEANAMPTPIYDNERPIRLPGEAGLLFDQLMANNLKAGRDKESPGSAITDPLAWTKMGAGNFAPTHSAGMGKGGST